MGTIKDYRNMVEQPWGKMFYEMIYKQRNIFIDKKYQNIRKRNSEMTTYAVCRLKQFLLL